MQKGSCLNKILLNETKRNLVVVVVAGITIFHNMNTSLAKKGKFLAKIPSRKVKM